MSVLCIMRIGNINKGNEKETAKIHDTGQASYLTKNDIDRSMNRKFKTVNELIEYISVLELDTKRFELLFDKNSIPVPIVPDSWGELISVHIDAVGCLTYEYEPKESNVIALPTQYPDNEYGITPTPAPTHAMTNRYQVAIRTYEAYEEEKNDYAKSLNSMKGNKFSSLADGSIVFLDSSRCNEISWIYEDSYRWFVRVGILDNEDTLLSDVTKLSFTWEPIKMK